MLIGEPAMFGISCLRWADVRRDSPLFKEEFQSKVHYAGTVIAGLATILWVCLSGMWYLPAVAFPIAVVIMLRYRKWLFWAEMAAFACAYVGVLIICIDC